MKGLIGQFPGGDVEDHPVQRRRPSPVKMPCPVSYTQRTSPVGHTRRYSSSYGRLARTGFTDSLLHQQAVFRMNHTRVGPDQIVDKIGGGISADIHNGLAEKLHGPVGIACTPVYGSRNIGDEERNRCSVYSRAASARVRSDTSRNTTTAPTRLSPSLIGVLTYSTGKLVPSFLQNTSRYHGALDHREWRHGWDTPQEDRTSPSARVWCRTWCMDCPSSSSMS